LLTAVTFFQNAPFFTNKILFFKNLILKIKYIKIKKRKRKKRGVAEPPHGGGWPPLGPWGWFGHPQTGRSGGGRTTPMAQGVPATPYGVVRPPLFFFFFFFFS
jgi:hypothetical protein